MAAVDPRAAVLRSMSLEGTDLTVGSHGFTDVTASDIVVVAIGKAAAAMAEGADAAVGVSRGLVVTTHESSAPFPMCIGSHPLPDDSSVVCGEKLVEFVVDTAPSDVLVFLVSGGGSAAALLPADGVTVGAIAEMNKQLIACGMPIEEINEVRAGVSRIKGGRLAAAARAERQVSLVLSDVVGAGPEHVASGPSIGFGLGTGAASLIDAYELRPRLPSSVVSAIDRSAPVQATSEPLFDVVGSPRMAAEAAVADLRSSGFDTSLVTADLRGEAREQAIVLVDDVEPGTVAVAAGETTVTLRGAGIGGRNQEAALSAALHIEDADVLFAALGTDGIDGPTDAAGAIVDGSTASRARELGVDLARALRENDSNTALAGLGDTVVTGPTGTNVADLWIVAKGPF